MNALEQTDPGDRADPTDGARPMTDRSVDRKDESESATMAMLDAKSPGTVSRDEDGTDVFERSQAMLATIRPQLVIYGGIWDGLSIQLTPRPTIIGRETTCDVIVDDPAVSRKHALIVDTPRGVVLRDLNSVNGPFVNDRNIGNSEHLLKDGDRIRLAAGSTALIIGHAAPGAAERDERSVDARVGAAA